MEEEEVWVVEQWKPENSKWFTESNASLKSVYSDKNLEFIGAWIGKWVNVGNMFGKKFKSQKSLIKI